MKIVTIKQAMQHVADNPEMVTDEMLAVPTHELVVRTLFEIANSPNTRDRGAMTRANVARTMIFNRLVGRRKSGSHPATNRQIEVEFVDLTGGAIES